jgi:hypothetical protein
MLRVPADEPTHPHPVRFWWFKRLMALGLALVLVLTVVRLAWGRQMAGRLATAEAAVRERGGATSVAELNQPSGIPPASNAATYLKTALTALRPIYGPSSSNLYWAEYPPYSPAWHKLAAAAFTANQPAFAKARAARPFARADWGLSYVNPLLSPPTTTLNTTRELANQLADAALYQHVQANDAAAVEHARDALHLARSLDQETTLIHHLVAEGIEAVALQRLIVIAPGMRIIPGDDVPAGAAVPSGAATRGQIEAIIRDLLEAPAPGESTAATLHGAEAVLVRDTLRWATRSNWAITPAIDGLEHKVLAGADAYARAATQPSAALASAAMPDPPAGGNAVLTRATGPRGRVGSSNGVLANWFGDISVNYSRVIEHDMRILTERRMAAVSLAAQLYRVDHAGRWPRKLDELVPTYLPAVPRDPFRADDGPLSYLVAKNSADGAERPMVYTVSTDGIDETPPDGSTVPPEPIYSWTSSRTPGRPNAADQWRDLSRFVPPKSAISTDEDGDGVPDDEEQNGATTAPAGEDAATRPAGDVPHTSTRD